MAATLLHHEATRPPEREYLNLLGNAPMMGKELTDTEKRDVEYVFPGFCYGCRGGVPAVYLCYGCERDAKPQ